MSNELAKAMAAILGEVDRIPKNGRNNYQNYDYATEGDALDKIRPLLSKYGIAVFYDAVEVWELDNNRTRVKVAVELIHGESGDSKTTHSFGEARDADKQGKTQDKGLYKAITGAIKYWVFKTFLISTGDDPENEQAAPQSRQQGGLQKKSQSVSQGGPSAISKGQLNRYMAIADEHKWTKEAQVALLAHYKITSRKDIPRSKYDEIIATLEHPGKAAEWDEFAKQQQETSAA